MRKIANYFIIIPFHHILEVGIMSNARTEKELNFMVPDKVGLLNEISKSLANAGVNIVSLTAYEMDGNANFMMVASDSTKAKEVLESKGYKADMNEVVLYELENKVGAMTTMTDKLTAAGINMRYLYGTTGTPDTPALLVFASDNNAKAIEVLNS